MMMELEIGDMYRIAINSAAIYKSLQLVHLFNSITTILLSNLYFIWNFSEFHLQD